ncbi:MAG: hypothetical protein VB108_08795 [Anaerolineaceae bacterium]|nr:hypothetical protein [Anaerolineaceae bacterium]
MRKDYPFPYETITLDGLSLSFLSRGGPRIIGLSYKGSANLLAEVPEKVEPTPYGPYYFVGGHRLWAAPEEKPFTYLPDDKGLTLKESANGIDLIGEVNPISGLQKILQIRLLAEGEIELVHLLRNAGPQSFTLAPWALTMLRPGGKAWFPTSTMQANPHGLLPDCRLSLWPYNRWDDPRVRYQPDHLCIDMSVMDAAPGKWGTFNGRGWMAYWLEGILFSKHFSSPVQGTYPDFGCNAETYLCDQFIELESLGPLQSLAPQAEIELKEIWCLQEFEQPIWQNLHVQYFGS